MEDDPDYETYQKYKRFVIDFEKKMLRQKSESLPLWKKADTELTVAACISHKYKRDSSVPNCDQVICNRLRNTGTAKYNTAISMVEGLSEEDKKLFWQSQVRNKDAKCFEELITKKEYEAINSNQYRCKCMNVSNDELMYNYTFQ